MDGSIIDKFNVHEKGAYMFGRLDLSDIVLQHPTISRFHAAGEVVLDTSMHFRSTIYSKIWTVSPIVILTSKRSQFFVEDVNLMSSTMSFHPLGGRIFVFQASVCTAFHLFWTFMVLNYSFLLQCLQSMRVAKLLLPAFDTPAGIT
ncbi:squamosa promoter-binding protein [Trifolium repens]|nr:squamosa promoter-binding protein [Trifolium repens]